MLLFTCAKLVRDFRIDSKKKKNTAKIEEKKETTFVLHMHIPGWFPFISRNPKEKTTKYVKTSVKYHIQYEQGDSNRKQSKNWNKNQTKGKSL